MNLDNVTNRLRLTKLYVAIGLLIITLLISVLVSSIAIDQALNNPPHKDDSSVSFYNQLIITDGNKIILFNPATYQHSILREVDKKITALDVNMDQSIFWSEENTPTIKSLSKNYKNIMHTEKMESRAMAVDFITEKLYIIDKSSETLNVFDMQGKYHGIILSDLTRPRDIVLDPLEGLMFIHQERDSIIKASMNGMNPTKIVNSRKLSAITIDCKTKTIYWAKVEINNGYNIQRANYMGENVKTLVNFKSEINSKIKSLAVLGSQLFWIELDSGNYGSALKSCFIEKEMCKNFMYWPTHFLTNPELIKVNNIQNYNELKENPCQKNNCNCQEICVLTSTDTCTCACGVGKQISDDLKTCQNVTEYLIYIQEDYIRGKLIDNLQNETFTDAIFPTKIDKESLQKSAMDFDYNYKKNVVYYSDDNKIYQVSIGPEKKTEVIFSKTESSYNIGDLAFDWYTDHLYFIQQSESIHKYHEVRKINTNDKTWTASIKFYKYNHNNWENESIYSLVLYPKYNYLYYVFDDGDHDIHRISLTSAVTDDLYTLSYIVRSKIIHIDYETNDIYFMNKAPVQKATIKKTDLNFAEVTNFYETEFEQQWPVTSLCIHKQKIYLSNYTSVWQFDRRTGANGIKVIPKFNKELNKKISGAKIFSSSRQSKNV